MTVCKAGLQISQFSFILLAGMSLEAQALFGLRFLISNSISMTVAVSKLKDCAQTFSLMLKMLGWFPNILRAISTGSSTPSVEFKR